MNMNDEPDIFKFINNNFNYELFFNKIYKLVFKDNLFCIKRSLDVAILAQSSIEKICNMNMSKWKFNYYSFSNLEEFILSVTSQINYKQITLNDINKNLIQVKFYLEILLNVLNLDLKDIYFKHYCSYKRFVNYEYVAINNEFNDLKNILNIVIKNLNFKTFKYSNGWIGLIKDDELIEKVLPEIPNLKTQQEIVNYKFTESNLEEKQKTLAFLAKELHIENDSKFYGTSNRPLNNVLNDCTYLLNNLDIRHDNKVGKSKNLKLESLSKEELNKYYDILFENMMLVKILEKQTDNYKEIEKLKSN